MEFVVGTPGRKTIGYFLLTILIGSALLALPFASTTEPIPYVDALFTATSAVCVTGLIVKDTGHDFTLAGQIIILILIQLGGLGIMTFATILLAAAGAHLSFQDRLGLSQNLGQFGGHTTIRLIRAVLVTTLLVEGVGAVLMFFVFRRDYPASTAAFYALFHSVSAFCNAGFSTFSTSLEKYRSDYFLIFVFSFLIIAGGLGFAVITEVVDKIRRRSTILSLHTKLCLAATLLLLIGGTVLFVLAELENPETLKTPIGGVVNCFFQAVTSRTAGFNTIPQQSFTEVSLLLTMILMFIGACPGSTAGGIKATTLAVIVLLVINRFRGRQSVAVFRRSISSDSIVRALTVALLSVLVIIFVFGLLMFAEERPVAHRLTHGWFVDNLFETVSAFGTVGLSLGRTGDLSVMGKLVIIVTMFVGRVGLLTLAFSLARPPQLGEVSYLDETVMVG